MSALYSIFSGEGSWVGLLPLILGGLFQLWMMVDAFRRQEWIWLGILFLFPGLSTVFYFFLVFRAEASLTRGFELPGTQERRRIKELQGQIHHLDKAHHHSQLGDLYFQQGKLDKAEASYRAALERDPQDLDTRAHLGQCLLRQKKAAEARPLIEGVIAENPRHEYGYSLMAFAEALTALGEIDAAIGTWKRVTENNSYARAKVQLAELLVLKNQPDLARAELKDVLADEAHLPAFQRRRDRMWLGRARKLMRKLG